MIKNYKQAIALCSLMASIFAGTLSVADTRLKTPTRDSLRTAGPYYNPASKSYFEYIKTLNPHFNWRTANKEAQKLYYKDTQGRLATVSTPETHLFILNKFKITGPVWIGLRYFCQNKKLEWVDNKDDKNTNFTAWDSQWHRSKIRCARSDYMPIYYKTNYKWQASGPEKGFAHFIVEYPTGKE